MIPASSTERGKPQSCDNGEYDRLRLLTKFHKLRMFKVKDTYCCYINSPISNIIECVDCINCINCILCVGLADKQMGHYLLNKLVTVGEFNEAIKTLNTPALPKHMEWAVDDKR